MLFRVWFLTNAKVYFAKTSPHCVKYMWLSLRKIIFNLVKFYSWYCKIFRGLTFFWTQCIYCWRSIGQTQRILLKQTIQWLTASSRSRLYCFILDCSFSIVSRSASLAFSSSSLICVNSCMRRSFRRTVFCASACRRCSASSSPWSSRTCQPTDHSVMLVDWCMRKEQRTVYL